MDKRPEVKFDTRINSVVRRLPESQQGEITYYAQEVHIGCRSLMDTGWHVPEWFFADNPSRPAAPSYDAVPRIVNSLVWSDLQIADGLNYPTPTASAAMRNAKEGEKRAGEIARSLQCEETFFYLQSLARLACTTPFCRSNRAEPEKPIRIWK